jgi:short chain dehydrogenase
MADRSALALPALDGLDLNALELTPAGDPEGDRIMTRIALITGGSRGIGRAAALALADDGTDVILTYRSSPEQADQVVAELRRRGRRGAARAR